MDCADLIDSVLATLGVTELCRSSRVSRRWRAAAAAKHLWTRLLRRAFPGERPGPSPRSTYATAQYTRDVEDFVSSRLRQFTNRSYQYPQVVPSGPALLTWDREVAVALVRRAPSLEARRAASQAYFCFHFCPSCTKHHRNIDALASCATPNLFFCEISGREVEGDR